MSSDNITLTWLTNTAISRARLYWENKFGFFSVKGVSVPAAVSAFPDELYQNPADWAEQAYPKLIHYNKLDKGGHFAAWEQPQLFLARGPRGLQITALVRAERRRVRRARRLPIEHTATTENSKKVRQSESRNHLPGLINALVFTNIVSTPG